MLMDSVRHTKSTGQLGLDVTGIDICPAAVGDGDGDGCMYSFERCSGMVEVSVSSAFHVQCEGGAIQYE